MEVDYIDDFLEVVQQKSYNKAAIKRNITTPGIKKRITHLEQYFGYKIFNTSHQGVQLTSDGAKLYAHLKIIKQQIDYLKNDDINTLEIGVISNLPIDKLRELNHCNDRIKLNFSNSTAQLISDLKEGKIDLVIGEQSKLYKDVYCEYWFEEPYELIFSKSHNFNNKKEDIDLLKEHFYLLEPPGDTFNFNENDIDPKNIKMSYVKDRESILNFIATSNSIAICPQSYTKKVNNDIYSHITLPNSTRTINVYAMKKSNIKVFYSILEEADIQVNGKFE